MLFSSSSNLTTLKLLINAIWGVSGGGGGGGVGVGNSITKSKILVLFYYCFDVSIAVLLVVGQYF